MVFNATFNNISVILWLSILLVEETTVPGESHRPAASHWQTLSQNVVLSTPCLSGIRTHGCLYLYMYVHSWLHVYDVHSLCHMIHSSKIWYLFFIYLFFTLLHWKSIAMLHHKVKVHVLYPLNNMNEWMNMSFTFSTEIKH